jgi:uncharacterized protein (DUF58 family)
MKKIALNGLALLCLLVAGVLPAQELKGPRIEVKQEQYDAGTVVQGRQVEHVFEVRNAGSEPLVIDRLQTS